MSNRRSPEKRPGSLRGTFSLRSHLMAVVVVALLPLLLFSAWLISQESNAEQSAIEENLLDTAKALAADVDREVISAINTLQILALSYNFEGGSADEFRHLSDRILSSQQNWRMVIVQDPAGKQLLSIVGSTPDTGLSSEEGIKNLQTAEQGQVIESPFAYLTGRSIGILVPVRRQEKTAYITSGLMKPQAFADILSQHKIPNEWLAAILDTRHIVVASTRSAEKFFGKPTQLLVEQPNQRGLQGWFRTKVEDVPSYVVFANAPASGWSVALAVPVAVVETPLLRKIWFTNGAGVIAAILGGFLASLIARRMARPIERLAAEAEERAEGKALTDFSPAPIVEANVLADALDESASLLKKREAERDSVQEQLRIQLQDLTRLHELSTNLLTIEDQNALFNEIVTGALILFKTDKGAVQLLNLNTKRLEVVGRIGYTNEVIELVQGALSEQGVSGTAVARRRSVLVEDIQNSQILDDKQRATALEAGIGAVHSIPLLGDHGEVVGVLTTYFARRWQPSEWEERLIKLYTQYCANIVEQCRSKERLRALSNQLEKRVLDRTRELQKTNDQLIGELAKKTTLENQLRQAQRMETIGTLAGGVAHDFNNILNIILGYASLLEQNSEDQTVADAVSAIKDMAQRGASLVRQLLAIAQKTEAKFAVADLNILVKNVTELLAQTFPKNIDIDVELDPKLPSTMADSNQITQAIINLCVNARDAMPDGGRLLLQTQILSANEAKQRFIQAEEAPYVCIRVSDTGSGIAKDTEEHIFEPFFTTKGPGQGTGLGLAVVYGIVRGHQGFIHFDTQPLHGTSFYLCLPAREIRRGRIPSDERLVADRLDAAGDSTVLLVEDEPLQLELLKTMFERKGYRVLKAADGVSAVAAFAAHKDEVAVVLLDFGLPKANGWEVLQKLKVIDPGVKVIFATGNLPTDIDAERLKAESCGVIMKPYVPAEALKKVAEVAH
jgi:signal transduction histidine kinase